MATNHIVQAGDSKIAVNVSDDPLSPPSQSCQNLTLLQARALFGVDPFTLEIEV